MQQIFQIESGAIHHCILIQVKMIVVQGINAVLRFISAADKGINARDLFQHVGKILTAGSSRIGVYGFLAEEIHHSLPADFCTAGICNRCRKVRIHLKFIIGPVSRARIFNNAFHHLRQRLSYLGTEGADRTQKLCRAVDNVGGRARMDYKMYCRDSEYLNLVLLEDTTDKIIRMVADHTCNIGILHYTSDQESVFFERLKLMELEWHVLESSPIAIQIRRDHPLAKQPFVTVSMLKTYPHITYVDEDVTHINYCSDISPFSNSIYTKRIVVQDRGTMRQMVNNTDGYYIGCDASRMNFYSETDPVCVPISDMDFTLKTAWIKRCRHTLTEAEQLFLDIVIDFLKV